MNIERDAPLMSRGMIAVIVAQFFSAFGDNALLFATLAVLKSQFYPDCSQPVLQMLFVATYILLAPFVGQMAEREGDDDRQQPEAAGGAGDLFRLQSVPRLYPSGRRCCRLLTG